MPTFGAFVEGDFSEWEDIRMKRILVVDDSPQIRDGLETLLGEAGFEVVKFARVGDVRPEFVYCSEGYLPQKTGYEQGGYFFHGECIWWVDRVG